MARKVGFHDWINMCSNLICMELKGICYWVLWRRQGREGGAWERTHCTTVLLLLHTPP